MAVIGGPISCLSSEVETKVSPMENRFHLFEGKSQRVSCPYPLKDGISDIIYDANSCYVALLLLQTQLYLSIGPFGLMSDEEFHFSHPPPSPSHLVFTYSIPRISLVALFWVSFPIKLDRPRSREEFIPEKKIEDGNNLCWVFQVFGAKLHVYCMSINHTRDVEFGGITSSIINFLLFLPLSSDMQVERIELFMNWFNSALFAKLIEALRSNFHEAEKLQQ